LREVNEKKKDSEALWAQWGVVRLGNVPSEEATSAVVVAVAEATDVKALRGSVHLSSRRRPTRPSTTTMTLSRWRCTHVYCLLSIA